MDLIVNCPHCNGRVVIYQINCGIFRHGVLKDSGKELNPHETKKVCSDLAKKGKIYGCGKPFKLVGKITEKCDYI